MKIFKLLLLLGFCGFVSCEKENGKEIPIDNENIPLLTKEIFGNALSNEYTYNDKNLLEEEKTKFSYTNYIYDSNNQLISYDFYYDLRIFSNNWATADSAMHRTEWVNPQNTKISGSGTYTYNHVNLERITVTSAFSSSGSYTTYDYDSNDRIGKKTFYSNSLPSGFVEYSYDKNGNLILETHKDLADGIAIVSLTRGYEFDDKENPYKAFKRLLLPGKYTNENNIVKETLTLFLDVPEVDNVQVTESSYEYNSLGYPVLKNNMIRFEYK